MRGRPVLGVVSGLLFGLFLALTLQQFGVVALTTTTVVGLPVLGILLGLGMATWAPLGRRASSAPPGRSGAATSGQPGHPAGQPPQAFPPRAAPQAPPPQAPPPQASPGTWQPPQTPPAPPQPPSG